MYYCEYCDFYAPNNSRYLKHLGTKKHANKYLEALNTLDNPIQNLVCSKVPKEKVQEKQNKNTEKIGEKKDLKENVQENKNLEENVQEDKDFVFLDTHFLDLYKSISIPLNPTFLWIIQLILSIKFLFHPFSNKTEENDLSGNE